MPRLCTATVLLFVTFVPLLTTASPPIRLKRQQDAAAAAVAEAIPQRGPFLNYLRNLGGPLLQTARNALMKNVIPQSIAGDLQRLGTANSVPKNPFPDMAAEFGSDTPKSSGSSAASSSSASSLSPSGMLGLSGIIDLSQLQGYSSGGLPGVAPIPVPTYPKPGKVRNIPGINSIPGLDSFNYIIGQLVPQAVQPVSHLLSGTISRILPKDAPSSLVQTLLHKVSPEMENIDVQKMMGRWYQVITSPHVFKESCTVIQFGALTNTSYSASFIVLKFFREGNNFGPPRMVLGYGFKVGENSTFTIHNSNSPNSEPFMVVKLGPLNEYNQYEYAVISNWIRYPVYVLARDPERFMKYHIKNVLQFMEEKRYINAVTKAFHLIAPVSYEECQYTPTF